MYSGEYVRWLQSAGAQVVPIRYDSTPSQIAALYAQINGVLFTGGGLGLELDSQYVVTAKHLYDLVMTSHADHVPLWGTCMGFQLLHILTAWNDSVLCEYCYASKNASWPLQLTSAAKHSRLFSGLLDSSVATLTRENSTFNWHRDGVTLGAYRKWPILAEFFDVLSLNQDRNGSTFISTVEAKNWPIYGAQWHGEKIYNFEPTYQIDHSRAAWNAMNNVAAFLVDEAKKNAHQFTSQDALQATLIDNNMLLNIGFGAEEYYLPKA